MARLIKNYRYKRYNIGKYYTEAAGYYYSVPAMSGQKHFKTLAAAKKWLGGYLKKRGLA